MYEVVTDLEVDDQVAALPDEPLPYYAQVLDLLEPAPWHSEPYNEARPDAGLLSKVSWPTSARPCG